MLIPLYIGSVISAAKLTAYGGFHYKEEELNQIVEVLWTAMSKS
ncbi:hypothetical protein [Marivirga lumbricoides]